MGLFGGRKQEPSARNPEEARENAIDAWREMLVKDLERRFEEPFVSRALGAAIAKSVKVLCREAPETAKQAGPTGLAEHALGQIASRRDIVVKDAAKTIMAMYATVVMPSDPEIVALAEASGRTGLMREYFFAEFAEKQMPQWIGLAEAGYEEALTVATAKDSKDRLAAHLLKA
ncbi:MAG TPA: hypothetical protein VM681_01750 [Candidatus Thermoplasmatota archaeon]|nr:hypothetical protein [Candidatus Thermoplasmatota archaeon]